MNGTAKSKSGTRIAAVMAVILVTAFLLTGTYAWTDFKQHTTAPLNGGEEVSTTLNDKFDPPDTWKAGQTVDKKVSVTNAASSTENIYARLQLKEYMECCKPVPVRDESNHIILFATYVDGTKKGEYMTWEESQAGGYNYTKYTVNQVDYARTNNNELKNGIYGKAMYTPGNLEIFGTAAKAPHSEQLHSEQTTAECAYNVHKWDGSSIANTADGATDKISDYISWALGSQVVSMSHWVTAGKPTGNFWILDEADGWVYWASALAPSESTSNILESVTLNVMPGSSFEYYIHIDMQTVTKDRLGDWQNNGGVSASGELLIEAFPTQPAPGWNNDGSVDSWWHVDNGVLTNSGYEIIIDQNGKIYLKTETTNVYKVCGEDYKPNNPTEFVYDTDGSLASDKKATGDEYLSDENGNIFIDENNLFPDPVLRNAVKNGTAAMPAIDSNSDGKLSRQEIAALEVFDMATTKTNVGSLSSLAGLEIFPNIKNLQINYNELTEIDCSGWPQLVGLCASNNNLVSVNVTACPDLTTLILHNNSLEQIDVSHNPSLVNLRVYYNNLTSLDLSKNIALDVVYCNDNKLTSLDISNNIVMTACRAQQNLLTSFTANNNAALTLELYLTDNQLKSLDISKTGILSATSVFITNNGMTELRINQAQADVGIGNNATNQKNGNNYGSPIIVTS